MNRKAIVVIGLTLSLAAGSSAALRAVAGESAQKEKPVRAASKRVSKSIEKASGAKPAGVANVGKAGPVLPAGWLDKGICDIIDCRGRDRDRDRDRDRRRGRYKVCTARDRGFEEHRRPHRGRDRRSACRACKKPTGPHGKCRFECEIVEILYRCEADYIPRDQDQERRTYPGERRRYRDDARYSAERRCEEMHREDIREGKGYCAYTRCDEERERRRTDWGRC